MCVPIDDVCRGMCPVTYARFVLVAGKSRKDDEAEEAIDDSGTNLLRGKGGYDALRMLDWVVKRRW